MKKPQFTNNEIYHLYNRGVEKRNVYLDKQDHYRFIHCLYEFNDQAPANNLWYHFNKNSEVQPRYKGDPLIEILAFCLMPNHYHLLVRQKAKKGIVQFMQKLGTGYTMYFNQKYDRVGGLFQGRFKAVPVTQNSHLLYLPYYIHLNPLDLIMPEWRQKEIKSWSEAIKYLENYRWSSHLDYMGKENFPSVTRRGFLLKIFGGSKKYKEGFLNWLREFNLDSIKDLTFE